MPLSLAEYAEFLESRDLLWPRVPDPIPVAARPSIEPLSGIRVVLWDVYGTLLRTPEGKFTLFPEPEVRLHVALEKTIHEFNMWNSMYRKPGPPWQSMINQYRDYIDRLGAVATKRRGDVTDVNLAHVWRMVVSRLFDKDYSYREEFYGDPDALSEKIAYFFHCNLQATEARAAAAESMLLLHDLGIRQGLLADGQPFSRIQLERCLKRPMPSVPVETLLTDSLCVLSHQLGVRKPSPSLLKHAIARLAQLGYAPEEVLHVSCRLETDLKPVKELGMKTALLAAEKSGLQAKARQLKIEETRPDRLLTDISQITSVVAGH